MPVVQAVKLVSSWVLMEPACCEPLFHSSFTILGQNYQSAKFNSLGLVH
jgi:hypothetical protein